MIQTDHILALSKQHATKGTGIDPTAAGPKDGVWQEKGLFQNLIGVRLQQALSPLLLFCLCVLSRRHPTADCSKLFEDGRKGVSCGRKETGEERAGG